MPVQVPPRAVCVDGYAIWLKHLALLNLWILLAYSNFPFHWDTVGRSKVQPAPWTVETNARIGANPLAYCAKWLGYIPMFPLSLDPRYCLLLEKLFSPVTLANLIQVLHQLQL